MYSKNGRGKSRDLENASFKSKMIFFYRISKESRQLSFS